MKDFFKNNKAIIVKGSIITFLIIVYIVLAVLKNNQAFAEWYSRTIQRGYLFALGHVTEFIPFSMMEVFFLTVIIIGIIEIVFIIINFAKIKPLKAISRILTLGLIATTSMVLFSVSFSFGYNRDKIQLDTYNGEIKQEDFKDMLQYFVGDYNYCCSQLEFKENGEVVSPYSLGQLGKILRKEYKKYDNEMLMDYTTSLKPLLFSFLFRDCHITGITFGITGEANINVLSTASEIPFTCAHELAHTKGVFKEEEADFVAAFITLNSDDCYVRYSGYCYTFSSIFAISYYTGDENDPSFYSSQISENIRRNSAYRSNYWKKHDLLAKFSDWVNNLYLKNNGIEEGTENYGDSEPEINETEHKITSLSNFQKIYFGIYYSNIL